MVLAAAQIGLTARRLLGPGAALALRAAFSGSAHFVTPAGELLVLTGDTVAAPWAIGVLGLPWAELAHGMQLELLGTSPPGPRSVAERGCRAARGGGEVRGGRAQCISTNPLVAHSHPAHLQLAGLVIDLGPARVWKSPPLDTIAPVEQIGAALALSSLPEAAPGLAGIGAELLVARLGQALASGAQAAVVAACAPLIGLGRGLTPAGDDLVTGALGVMALAGRPCPAPALAGRTTALGATQVAHAAAGALIEPLHAVSAALLAGAPAPAEALARLLALGHSSGADMLAGARLALSHGFRQTHAR